MKKHLLSLVFLLSLATITLAQNLSARLEYAGLVFQPQVYTLNGQDFFATDDPQISSLVERANVRIQRSSSGNTLFAFAPGRESYWSVGSSLVKVNGQEQTAPGQIVISSGKQLIEPKALFYALAIKGEETAQGYSLYPTITELTADSSQSFLLRSATKLKPKTTRDSNSLVLSIQGFGWDGPSKIVLNKTEFTFSGGKKLNDPLEIRVHPEPFTKAKVAGTTLLNETKISLQPDFPGVERAKDVALSSLKASASDDLKLLTFEFDGPTTMHYINDTENGLLKILIPRASYLKPTFKSSDWPGLAISQYETDSYPVLQLEIPTARDGMEFAVNQDLPTTLILKRGPTDKVSALMAYDSIQTPGYSIASGTIVIDPGHGGSDPGCRNGALGVREADITLAISLKLAEVLRAQGWNVILTRESDRDVTYAGSPDMDELCARADVANNIKADLFVSIHCNASVNTSATGSSIHWWKVEDYQLAQSLEHVLGSTIGFGDKGLIRDRFVVLRHTKMPAVLVETAFLSNYREGSMLSDPNFQSNIAQQLAGGLASYISGRYASRGSVRPLD